MSIDESMRPMNVESSDRCVVGFTADHCASNNALHTTVPKTAFATNDSKKLIKACNNTTKNTKYPKKRVHFEGRPKRPRSAYNLFFQYGRAEILKGASLDITKLTAEDVDCIGSDTVSVDSDLLGSYSDSSSAGKKAPNVKSPNSIGFKDLARTIASKWKDLPNDKRALFEERAQKEKMAYRKEMEEWKKAIVKGGDSVHAFDGKFIPVENDDSEFDELLDHQDILAEYDSSLLPPQMMLTQPVYSHEQQQLQPPVTSSMNCGRVFLQNSPQSIYSMVQEGMLRPQARHVIIKQGHLNPMSNNMSCPQQVYVSPTLPTNNRRFVDPQGLMTGMAVRRHTMPLCMTPMNDAIHSNPGVGTPHYQRTLNQPNQNLLQPRRMSMNSVIMTVPPQPAQQGPDYFNMAHNVYNTAQRVLPVVSQHSQHSVNETARMMTPVMNSTMPAMQYMMNNEHCRMNHVVVSTMPSTPASMPLNTFMSELEPTPIAPSSSHGPSSIGAINDGYGTQRGQHQPQFVPVEISERAQDEPDIYGLGMDPRQALSSPFEDDEKSFDGEDEELDNEPDDFHDLF